MNKRLLLLIALFTLCSCVNKEEIYSLHDTSCPIAIWADAKRYQNDEFTISITARHTPEYSRFANALDMFTIARSIAVIDENNNQAWISTFVKIGTIKDFFSDKYDFYSNDMDVVVFTDSFTTEFGMYDVSYEIIDAEHDPRDNGFAFYPTITFRHSSKGYTIQLP